MQCVCFTHAPPGLPCWHIPRDNASLLGGGEDRKTNLLWAKASVARKTVRVSQAYAWQWITLHWLHCMNLLCFSRPVPATKPKPKFLEAPDGACPPPDGNIMTSPENVPVESWLKSILMDRYTDVFHKSGYKTVKDCLGLTKEDLQGMGISARGHLHKITTNLPSSKASS